MKMSTQTMHVIFLLSVLGASLVDQVFCAPESQQKSCSKVNGQPAYYDSFVGDFEMCPKDHPNKTCSELDRADGRQNCLKCCPMPKPTERALRNERNIGIIVGPAVGGGLVLVLIMIAVGVYCYRSRRRRQQGEPLPNRNRNNAPKEHSMKDNKGDSGKNLWEEDDRTGSDGDNKGTSELREDEGAIGGLDTDESDEELDKSGMEPVGKMDNSRKNYVHSHESLSVGRTYDNP